MKGLVPEFHGMGGFFMDIGGILGSILGLAGTGIFGAITGLLGTAITSFVNYKNQKMQNEFKLKMKLMDYKIMEATIGSAERIAKDTTSGLVEATEAAAFQESIKQAENPPMLERWGFQLFNITGPLKYLAIPCAVLIMFLLGILDFIKTLMRPALTIYLTAGTTVITYMSWIMIDKAGLTAVKIDDALAIFLSVINIVLYLTVSSITWWFGDRRTAKYIDEMMSRSNPVPIPTKPLVNGKPEETKPDTVPIGDIKPRQ
jgi:hypothetical protein